MKTQEDSSGIFIPSVERLHGDFSAKRDTFHFPVTAFECYAAILSSFMPQCTLLSALLRSYVPLPSPSFTGHRLVTSRAPSRTSPAATKTRAGSANPTLSFSHCLSHVTRLTWLDSRDSTHVTRLTWLDSRDSTHETRLTRLDSRDSTHETRLTRLDSRDSTHETRLTRLNSHDSTHKNSSAIFIPSVEPSLWWLLRKRDTFHFPVYCFECSPAVVSAFMPQCTLPSCPSAILCPAPFAESCPGAPRNYEPRSVPNISRGHKDARRRC